MWYQTFRRLSSDLRHTLRRSGWTHRLKEYGHSSRRDYSSQWLYKRLRIVLGRHARKGFALTATGIYNASKDEEDEVFPWKNCNINDQTLEKLSDEMKDVEQLKLATIICSVCNKRLMISNAIKGKEYCSCPNNKAVTDDQTQWQPFLEEGDIIIWRKEENPGQGLYSYKVYGCYSEISGEDFLAMNLDTDYWRTWDATAKSLRILEAVKDIYGGQCVMHWEMEWPKFFSNRDYVYVRKYGFLDPSTGQKVKEKSQTCTKVFGKICTEPDQEQNQHKDELTVASDALKINKENLVTVVIVSRSCEHPEAPETNSAYRVKEYWSNLVIKPFTDFKKPGIEFSLTYFDDPGTNIPSALQSWVAGYGMPDYLSKMRKAAAFYRKNGDFKNVDTPVSENENELDNLDPENPFVNNNDIVSAEVGKSNEGINLQQEVYEKVIVIDSTEEFLNLINGKSDTKKIEGATLNEKSTEDRGTIQLMTTDKKHVAESTVSDNNVCEAITETKVELKKEQVANTTQGDEKIDGATSENQDKLTNQNAASRYNYWHLWPLYYFA